MCVEDHADVQTENSLVKNMIFGMWRRGVWYEFAKVSVEPAACIL